MGARGEEEYGQRIAAPLKFLLWSFLVSVVIGDASALPPCSRMLPCSWIVISHCSCEGSEVRNDLCRHLEDILSAQLLSPYEAKMFCFHIFSEV